MNLMNLLKIPGTSSSEELTRLYNASQKRMEENIKNQRIAALLMSKNSRSNGPFKQK